MLFLHIELDKQNTFEVINFMEEKYLNFKSLLEYFVTHLEYCQNNEDKSTRGYHKYLKDWIEGTDKQFKKSGWGSDGDNIQK
ncbi:hypothetical protein Q787_11260 [Ornithobacterium rhinotracheale H06-030791]|nr:hypothetical protein Q785_11730 [Ornithobacterium rhinotracheale ORT-UMN 88]KGB65867.1 hypothetical protein Q787_11260 [Ornithobacterium rhinotracheale H06-030791]